MDTIYLNPKTWDLAVDEEGNIATAKSNYALSQDVASACRLFSGELYYDARKGIPYFEKILGKKVSFALYQHWLQTAALTVPGVESARASLTLADGRIERGYIATSTAQGDLLDIGL